MGSCAVTIAGLLCPVGIGALAAVGVLLAILGLMCCFICCLCRKAYSATCNECCVVELLWCGCWLGRKDRVLPHGGSLPRATDYRRRPENHGSAPYEVVTSHDIVQGRPRPPAPAPRDEDDYADYVQPDPRPPLHIASDRARKNRESQFQQPPQQLTSSGRPHAPTYIDLGPESTKQNERADSEVPVEIYTDMENQ